MEINTIWMTQKAEPSQQKKVLKDFILEMDYNNLKQLLFITQKKRNKINLKVYFDYGYCCEFNLSIPNMETVFSFLYYDLNLGDHANYVRRFSNVISL